MKPVTKKNTLFFPALLLVCLLLIVPVKDLMTDVYADVTDYTVQLLEITESGVSDLESTGSPHPDLVIETMSMKQFTASREDLNGRYDAIYVGRGLYSKDGVQNASGNTKNVMNDITELKAHEIMDDYINKGLYVFFHNQPFLNQTAAQRGVLYNTFNTYRSDTPRTNVVFIQDTEIAALTVALADKHSRYAPGLRQRPSLSITNRNEIKDYVQGSRIYSAGDTLNFNINVSNVVDIARKPVIAKLLLSEDPGLLTEEDVVASATINHNTNNVITYKLPAAYSGLMHWKLEIMDTVSGQQFKDYDSGIIRYRHNKSVIKILQVGTGVSLPANLLNSDDYQLNLSTLSVADFNTYISNHSAASPKYGLNGTYDTLIVNYSDMFSTGTAFSASAKTAIKEFASGNKRGVIYLFNAGTSSSGNWESDVQQSGQQNPVLAANPGTLDQPAKLVAVNSPSYVQYPVYISEVDKATQALTSLSGLALSGNRNLSLTLDLEDRNVIPLYNLASETRDTHDSYNHYMAYSKGNEIYMGNRQLFAGSTSVVWNQLLVNSIHNLYITSNHSPEITLNSPALAGFPSYQKQFVLNYSVKDPDLVDTDLITSVRFKSNGSYLANLKLDETAVKSGSSISRTFSNPLPGGGTLQIEITAKDSHGAATTKLFNVSITQTQAPKANLDIRKRISSANMADGKVEVNEAFSMEYTILPTSIPVANVNAADRTSTTLTVSDVRFEDLLPSNIAVVNALPDGMSSTGTVSSGVVLSKNLGHITYKLNSSTQTFEPERTTPFIFTVELKVTAAGKYSLAGATLNFEDIHRAAFEPDKSTSGSTLGIAGDYNIFALASMDTSLGGFNVDGSIAAAQDIITGNKYGSFIFNPSGEMVAGQDIYYNDQVNSDTGVTINGNITYGRNFIKNVRSLSSIKGTISQGTPIDFDTTGNYLRSFSAQLSNLTPRISVETINGNQLKFKGTNPTTNIFQIDASRFTQYGGIIFDIPKDSAAIVNIAGSQVAIEGMWTQFTNQNTSNEIYAKNILYNFYEAKQINFTGELYGSILAPNANISFVRGNTYGTMIISSINYPAPQNGSVNAHMATFKGTVPNPPTPTPTPFPRATMNFPSIHLEAVKKVSGVQLEADDVTIYVGETRKLIATVTPADADNQRLEWETNVPAIVSVDRISGIIEGLAVGKSIITVRATDTISSNRPSDTIEVTVVERPSLAPTLEITGKDTAIVGEPVNLHAVYSHHDDLNIKYSWTITSGGQLLDQNDSNITFSADHSGTYTVTASIINTITNLEIIKTAKVITVTHPATSIEIKGDTQVLVGKFLDLDLLHTPEDADPLGEVTWQLVQDGEYATLTNITNTKYRVTANYIPGKKVTVTATIGNLVDEHQIDIIELLSLQFNPAELTIAPGQHDALLNRLYPNPTSIKINDIAGDLTWANQNDQVVKLEPGGNITGLTLGDSEVTVTYKLPNSDKTVTAKITIKVRNSVDRY